MLSVTIRQFLSVLFRRWYIVLGLLACAALVTVMLARDGGIYTTRAVVSFMRPTGTSLSPTNGTDDPSIIAFAAVVAQETNDRQAPAGYSMQDAPYYGAGIRQGAVVGISDSGNQWVSNVNKAEIEIQVVGRTLDWVKSKQQELVREVLDNTQSQQAALGVPPQKRIAAAVVPLTTEIELVSASAWDQLAAAVAMLLAAIILGAWGSITVDRWLSRRRSATESKAPAPADIVKEGSIS
jgi:hypothetical protein